MLFCVAPSMTFVPHRTVTTPFASANETGVQ